MTACKMKIVLAEVRQEGVAGQENVLTGLAAGGGGKYRMG